MLIENNNNYNRKLVDLCGVILSKYTTKHSLVANQNMSSSFTNN